MKGPWRARIRSVMDHVRRTPDTKESDEADHTGTFETVTALATDPDSAGRVMIVRADRPPYPMPES
jgi:hypothetical protein